MAVTPLVIKDREATGLVFGLPADPELYVRFKKGKTRKNLANNVQTDNHTIEIIAGNEVPVQIDGIATREIVSMKLRISGSAYSLAEIKKLASVLGNLQTWLTENVAIGYDPVTVPSITTP